MIIIQKNLLKEQQPKKKMVEFLLGNLDIMVHVIRRIK